MEALIGIVLFVACWLTYLTNRSRKQKIENKILEKNNKYYLSEIIKLKEAYGQEEKEAGEENQKTE